MAFEKKSREQWEAEAKAKALQKTVSNIEEIKDAVKAVGVNGDKIEVALLLVLISEMKNLNNNLYWIQHELKKQGRSGQSDQVPF